MFPVLLGQWDWKLGNDAAHGRNKFSDNDKKDHLKVLKNNWRKTVYQVIQGHQQVPPLLRKFLLRVGFESTNEAKLTTWMDFA